MNRWTILEEIPRMLIKVRKLSAICPFASLQRGGVNTKICEFCRLHFLLFLKFKRKYRSLRDNECRCYDQFGLQICQSYHPFKIVSQGYLSQGPQGQANQMMKELNFS